MIFFLSLISFLIPWLLMLGVRIKEKVEIYNFAGTYLGVDRKSNHITVEIKSNREFKIRVDNCNEANDSGSWKYVKEYDAFLFSTRINEISINYNYMGELILNSNIVTDCCELKNVKLSKK